MDRIDELIKNLVDCAWTMGELDADPAIPPETNKRVLQAFDVARDALKAEFELCSSNEKLWHQINFVLNPRIDELQKTLAWYGDINNYRLQVTHSGHMVILPENALSKIDEDAGQRAREVLK